MTESSCVAYHSTIESLYDYINEMAQSFGVIAPRFERTGVFAHADAEVSHSLEADHSSFPCSSGKALYSEVLKRKPKVCKSVTTEVRSSDFQLPEVEVQNTRSNNVPMPQPVCNVLPSKGKRGRRENQDELSEKRVKKSHVENVVVDDIIITDVSIPEIFFSPLTLRDQQALCELLLLTNDNSDCDVATNFGPIAGPCQTKSIKPDGNCFFRSLAYAICGSEDKHLKIRRAVVKHLKMNASIFERYVRSEYTSVEDYLTQSRVYYSGSWVTEIDIFASADLFKTTIMTFNDGRWNAHKPTGEVIANNAIYLKNCNGNHYEVVTCVKHRDQDICAGKCGNATSNEVRMPCLRKRKVSDAAQQNKIDYAKTKYHDDTDYRATVREYSKKKYLQNLDFQERVREYSKKKYLQNLDFQERVREYSKKKYVQNLVFKARVREYSKKKYLQNLDFQERVCEYSKKKYLQNLVFKARVREYSKKKYLQNLDFQERVREYSKKKYLQNLDFKERVREYSKKKYLQNLVFKARVREYSKKKYLQNLDFQERVREYSKKKYLQNMDFKERVREYSKKKYLQNLDFKERVREYSKKKYLQNLVFKARVREYSKKKYLQNLDFQER
ncbi:hypothetical protein PO909_029510 [Leuciscus waleckii]